MFDRNWAAFLENNDPDSFIGQCAAKADAVLRWIDAAGFELKPK